MADITLKSGIASNRVSTAPVALPRAAARPRFLNVPALAAVIVSISAIFIGARLYQQAFAWEYGLDSRAPEFEIYWMTVFYAEITIIAVGGMGLWTYIWVTRDRDLASVTPRQELRRQFNGLIWIFAFAFSFYWGGSFLAEQDAAWHQTVIRDTSFTPSHIFLFYLGSPLSNVIGIAGFLYAHTRLPQFQGRISLPFVLGISGPILILPNVGYNEWGHTFWLMEEYFTAPLHWGFVILGWSALALGGILLQFVSRVAQLLRVETDPEFGNFD